MTDGDEDADDVFRAFREQLPQCPSGWAPGDRVVLDLPDNGRRYRNGWPVTVTVAGTVSAVDVAGQPAGVLVDLDQEINGMRDCYATHEELRRTRKRRPVTRLA